jgi:predicted metal-dependent hydrolase
MLTRLRNWAAPPAIEQREIRLGGQQIPYTLKRSARRRSIGLRIDDRGLTVSMPLRASERWLQSVLLDKSGWVIEKLRGWQSRKSQALRWHDGEALPFLGGRLTLRIQYGLFDLPAQRQAECLWIFVRDAGDSVSVAAQVSAWYRAQAEILFAGRVNHFAAQMNVAPRAVKISAAKTQWGSCSVRGIIRLNQGLIRLPQALIDYVVVHELAHLREMNHSAAFWQVVAAACPDYLELRRELRAFAPG